MFAFLALGAFAETGFPSGFLTHQTAPTRVIPSQSEANRTRISFSQGRARACPARTSRARRSPRSTLHVISHSGLPSLGLAKGGARTSNRNQLISKQLKPNQAPPLPSMGQRDSIRSADGAPDSDRASSLRCEEQNQNPRQRHRGARYGNHSSPCGHYR